MLIAQQINIIHSDELRNVGNYIIIFKLVSSIGTLHTYHRGGAVCYSVGSASGRFGVGIPAATEQVVTNPLLNAWQ